MPLILGHRGYSAKYLENSMQAFRAALDAGMDGFELDVQPTSDGVCVVLHDDDLARTAQAAGTLRRMEADALPLLKNGERLPLLSETLALPAKLINVELKGTSGWKPALDEVMRASAIGRVFFSSFEHDQIFALRSACPGARCGLLWTTDQTSTMTAEQLSALPSDFSYCLPLAGVRTRTDFWAAYAQRIVLWGMQSAAEPGDLPFAPAIIVADGP